MTTGFVTTDSGKIWITKDPDATLDYTWDWTNWLAASSPADTITQHNIVLSGSTTALLASSAVNSGKVTAWISGGAVGEQISVRCRITTSSGRIDDRTFLLKIKER